MLAPGLPGRVPEVQLQLLREHAICPGGRSKEPGCTAHSRGTARGVSAAPDVLLPLGGPRPGSGALTSGPSRHRAARGARTGRQLRPWPGSSVVSCVDRTGHCCHGPTRWLRRPVPDRLAVHPQSSGEVLPSAAQARRPVSPCPLREQSSATVDGTTCDSDQPLLGTERGPGTTTRLPMPSPRGRRPQVPLSPPPTSLLKAPRDAIGPTGGPGRSPLPVPDSVPPQSPFCHRR